MSYHRKRSHDGAIIYYRGEPFCVDFSGDPKTVLTEGHMASMGENMQKPPSNSIVLLDANSTLRAAGQGSLV